METVTDFPLWEFEVASGKDPAALRAMAARDGYLFFRGLIPEEIVQNLRRAVLEFAAQAGWLDPSAPPGEARAFPGKRIGSYEDPEWVKLQLHAQASPAIRALGDLEALRNVIVPTDERGGALCLSAANTVRVFSPHPDMATRPHQDAHYVRMLGDFWTAWIPLGDCPRRLGGLAILPGSHRGGLCEHGRADSGVDVAEELVWRSTDYACGDAVVFSSFTLHRSLPNNSGDQLRLSADFRYGFWDGSSEVDWRAASGPSQRDVIPE